MALVIKSRVRETSTTTGTGTYTLAGAETSFRAFSGTIGNGNTTPYLAILSPNWEEGIGTVGAGTLARTEVTASSNADNPVNWGPGTKQIACAVGASLIPLLQGGNTFEGSQIFRNENATGDVSSEVRADGDYTPRRTLRKANVTGHVARVWQDRVDSTGTYVIRDATAAADRLEISLFGTLFPGATGTQNFGNNDRRWKYLYLSDSILMNGSSGDRTIDMEAQGDGNTAKIRMRKTAVTSDTAQEYTFDIDSGGRMTLTNVTDGIINWIISSTNGFVPGVDNALSLGNATHRWSEVFAGNGTINTSDGRLKKDVEDADLGLEFIEALRPVSYRWVDRDDPPNVRHYGLIAQDIEDVLTGRPFGGLYHDAESDRYGLIYTQLIPVLIKAVQELSARVAELEKR